MTDKVSDSRPVKPVFPWKTAALVAAVTAVSVGTTLFLVKRSSFQTKPALLAPKTGITAAPTVVTNSPAPVTVLPANGPACDVSNDSFCKVLADLKAALSAKNYAGFLVYQNLQSITCNPDGIYMPICKGEAKGTVKEGYMIGHNRGEGIIVNKGDYAAMISICANKNGPFIYQGSLLSGDKGVAVFLNQDKDHLMVFPLKRTDGNWRMNSPVMGETYGDNSFDNLSDSLLNLVQ